MEVCPIRTKLNLTDSGGMQLLTSLINALAKEGLSLAEIQGGELVFRSRLNMSEFRTAQQWTNDQIAANWRRFPSTDQGQQMCREAAVTASARYIAERYRNLQHLRRE